MSNKSQLEKKLDKQEEALYAYLESTKQIKTRTRVAGKRSTDKKRG